MRRLIRIGEMFGRTIHVRIVCFDCQCFVLTCRPFTFDHTAIVPGKTVPNTNPQPNMSRKKVAEDVDTGTCPRVDDKKGWQPILQGQRCVICTKLDGATSASRITTQCPTCFVFLCTKVNGNNKTTCWAEWHGVANLDQITKVKTITPLTRASPRKPSRSSPRKGRTRSNKSYSEPRRSKRARQH